MKILNQQKKIFQQFFLKFFAFSDNLKNFSKKKIKFAFSPKIFTKSLKLKIFEIEKKFQQKFMDQFL